MNNKNLIKEILIASNNKGKVKEIKDLLTPFNYKILSTEILGNIDEPEETGDSFAENALIKAKYYSEKSGKICLSDDSGIEVHSLNNMPGIYSARWGGVKKDFNLAMQKVEDALNENGINTRYEGQDIADYNKKLLSANFTCALCLYFPNGEYKIFEGKVFGTLTFPPRGDAGFGYDPIFIAEGHNKTFAEIEPEFKHQISHRAKAFEKFVNYLKS
ncbi:MAG: RdgB/HAM1 family non-canonical purine NTP pyrophosphatase [Rickettsiales bacterium]|nr:RdgB/HAM1 family non-canonical purine NTP pyrophosphatase [Rickettsiales bacterium]